MYLATEGSVDTFQKFSETTKKLGGLYLCMDVNKKI